MTKDLHSPASLVAAFLVTVLAVGYLAPTPMAPDSSLPADAPEVVEEDITSPTPVLRDAPAFPSPEGGLPEVLSTYPADGEVDVPRNASLRVDFSTPADLKALTWTISPAVELVQRSLRPGPVAYLDPAAPFDACTEYEVRLESVRVGTGATNPWTFTTFCGGSIALGSPAGGEDWTGGSLHTVEWTESLTDGRSKGWTLDRVAGDASARIAVGAGGNGTHRVDWRVPVANLTDVRLRVCVAAGLRLLPVLCDTSGGFAIDASPPALVGHSPADGAADVPLAVTLSATFSEPMNAAATASAFTIAPAATVASRVWSSPNVLQVRLEGLRNATRYSWGLRCSAVDASLPGNPLAACTQVHGFTTTLRASSGPGPNGTEPGRSTLPGVSLDLGSPVGDEVWTGGSVHPIPFTVRNNATVAYDLLVTAGYRCLDRTCTGWIGTLSVSVAPGSTAAREVPWTLPRIDAPDVVVNVTAVDVRGIAWAEGGPVRIDSTPPTVVMAVPSGPHVRADPAVAVTFSEPLVTTSDPVSALPALTVSLRWSPARTALAADLLGTTECTAYTVALAGLRDLSDPGNPLGPTSWALATECMPTVALLSPDGGEDWTGGAVHDLRWVAADQDDARLILSISYSLDGGADGFPNAVANGLVVGVGMGTRAWVAPRVDSGSVAVRIAVSDPAGNTALDASAAVFTIDSTPPRLLASFPGDGSATAWASRDLWFVFSERVDRASFLAAFRLSPDPGGRTYAWATDPYGRDTLLVGHGAFDANHLTTASFAEGARDDSDPGNPLAMAVAVRFVAVAVPPGPPPVAFAAGQGRVNVGDPATFDATGSTGNITRYDWAVRDGDGRLVAVLLGPKARYTFPRAGPYRVTLTVTDASGASDFDTVEISVLPVADWLLVLIAATGITAAAGQAFVTERGRFRLLRFFLLPLYARREKDELLEHEKRGMIRGYILVHPGDSYTDIKRNLGLSNGTLQFHLAVLEREGIIRSQSMGTRKVFYPRGVALPENGGNLHEVQLRIVRAVRELPGLETGDLAAALGISRQHAIWHLRVLNRKNLVRLERHGWRLRCYPPAAREGDASPAEGRESGETRVQDS